MALDSSFYIHPFVKCLYHQQDKKVWASACVVSLVLRPHLETHMSNFCDSRATLTPAINLSNKCSSIFKAAWYVYRAQRQRHMPTASPNHCIFSCKWLIPYIYIWKKRVFSRSALFGNNMIDIWKRRRHWLCHTITSTESLPLKKRYLFQATNQFFLWTQATTQFARVVNCKPQHIYSIKMRYYEVTPTKQIHQIYFLYKCKRTPASLSRSGSGKP